MSRYLYKKIQNISPESLNFQHSGLKLTTLGSDPGSPDPGSPYSGFPLHSESAIPTFGTGRRFLAFIATQYNNPPSTPPTVL